MTKKIAHISHDFNPKLAVCGVINTPPNAQRGEKIHFCEDCAKHLREGTVSGD